MLQSGLTPLHLTAQEDKVSAAEVLAKYDANLDQQTKVSAQTQLPFIHYWRGYPGCQDKFNDRFKNSTTELMCTFVSLLCLIRISRQ